jgi:NAD(P)H dehydrogenase (quinone)
LKRLKQFYELLNNKNIKITITSAIGKLGASIAQHLIQEIGNENVIGIARTPDRAKNLGVEIRRDDYNSRKDFDLALQGIDRVL